jgi:hypothetical protein
VDTLGAIDMPDVSDLQSGLDFVVVDAVFGVKHIWNVVLRNFAEQVLQGSSNVLQKLGTSQS